jgi:hypothetical protein
MGLPAVTVATLGAWLVKARPDGLPLAELRASDFAGLTSRCVRPTYRAELVERGQPVLLWVSGRDPQHPAGIHAAGETTGGVQDDGSELSMSVRLHAIDPVVRREEILAHPVLRDLEVVRMPAGSNPSYLDRAQYRTLRQAFPQLHLGWVP